MKKYITAILILIMSFTTIAHGDKSHNNKDK